MNTSILIPLPDLREAASVLHLRELVLQRHKVLSLLKVLNLEINGYPGWGSESADHITVAAWNGYTEHLIEWGCVLCKRYRDMGYNDRVLPKLNQYSWGDDVRTPPWYGPAYHRRCRITLYRLHPAHYRTMGWDANGNIFGEQST